MDQQPAYYLKKPLIACIACSSILLLSAAYAVAGNATGNADSVIEKQDTKTESGTIKSADKSTEKILSTVKFILPPDHQSTYSIEKYDSHVGDMHNVLKQTGNQVKYTSETNATGFASLFVKNDVNETSLLNWFEETSGKTLRQQSYQLFRGKKHKKNQNISFNWPVDVGTDDRKEIRINGNYKKRSYELLANQPVWGRHFLTLLMSNEFLSNKGKQTNTFHITDKGSSQKYTYTLEKAEKLFFSGKNYPVLKYRIIREGSSRMSYTWLSKEHYYLPLKIEQYKDHKLNVSMLMTEFRLTKDTMQETKQEVEEEEEEDDYE